MKFSIFNFISSQWTTPAPVVNEDLSGQTVMILGANAGIGFESAKHFANMNCGRLIMACRSQQKGEEAVTNLKHQTGYEHAELWILDLADFASVKTFYRKFVADGGRLDIVVANAGVIPLPDAQPTVDGWETAFQVNNLSSSLIPVLLIPVMLQTASKYGTTPRIVVVSSDLHHLAKIDQKLIDSPNILKTYGTLQYLEDGHFGTRYFESKLMNVFFARALSARLGDAPLIVNSVTPGYCRTAIRASFTGFRKVVDFFMNILMGRTAEEGSRQIVWAAVGGKDHLDALRGGYVSMAKVEEPSDYVLTEEGRMLQDRLWDELIEELIKIEPEVQKVVTEHLSPSSSS